MAYKKNVNFKDGLDALFLLNKSNASAISANKDNNKEMIYLPLHSIIISRFQPRLLITEDALNELVDSIRSIGILQPIIVRQNGSKYEIIAGERRWRAAAIAGLENIPAVICDATDEEVAAFALIENLQREDLNPIEEANGYQKLIDEFGLKHDEIAKKVGKSRTTITNALRLLNLEHEIKTLLQNAKLEMGHARALLSLTAKKQVEVAHLIVNKQLSVRETERLVQRIKNPAPVLQQPSKELVNWADNLSNQLSKRLSSEVKIHVNYKGEGRVTINFLSPDEIDWLANALK